MKKIIIALVFVFAATFVNAQQVDTVKTEFKLTNAKEFLHDTVDDQWYILYKVKREKVEVYCSSEDFFDVLAWKNERFKKEEKPHWQVLYLGKEGGYRLVRKENAKNRKA